jgi:hypothetical protein
MVISALVARLGFAFQRFVLVKDARLSELRGSDCVVQEQSNA